MKYSLVSCKESLLNVLPCANKSLFTVNRFPGIDKEYLLSDEYRYVHCIFFIGGLRGGGVLEFLNFFFGGGGGSMPILGDFTVWPDF